MEKLEVDYNTLQAIIALNTLSRNILLAKFAYTQGAVGAETVEKMRQVARITMKTILKNTVDSKARKELQKIVNQISCVRFRESGDTK